MKQEKKSVSHFLVYVDWSTIKSWKHEYHYNHTCKTKVEFPFAYASKQRRLLLASPGDVVWVISSPIFDSYRLPPSLIARLQVYKAGDIESLIESGVQVPKASLNFGKNVVLGDTSLSKYFPINNAYRMLLSLTFTGKSPSLSNCIHCERLYKTGKRLYSGIPAHLQTVRQLTPSSGDVIEDFARGVDRGQMVFLSYRRKEAECHASEIVEELIANNYSCWYDNRMIPQQVAKGVVLVEEKLLSDVLTDGLRQSVYFVALVTPTYHRKDTWTQKEWQSAIEERDNSRRRRPLRLVEILMGGEPSNEADIVLKDESSLSQQLSAINTRKTAFSQT
jgi:hypothetical protein